MKRMWQAMVIGGLMAVFATGAVFAQGWCRGGGGCRMGQPGEWTGLLADAGDPHGSATEGVRGAGGQAAGGDR